MMVSDFLQFQQVETPTRSGRLCCWTDGTGWLLGYGCCTPSELDTPKVEGKKQVESIGDTRIPVNAWQRARIK